MSGRVTINMQPYDPESPPEIGRQLACLLSTGRWVVAQSEDCMPAGIIGRAGHGWISAEYVETWGYLP